jgi:putative FmdB family regulatory protein
MPIYEYMCRACGNCFTVLTLSASAEKVVCPSCGSTDCSKQLSSFSCSSTAGLSSGGGGSFGGGGG